jgi:hypothetical protein
MEVQGRARIWAGWVKKWTVEIAKERRKWEHSKSHGGLRTNTGVRPIRDELSVGGKPQPLSLQNGVF